MKETKQSLLAKMYREISPLVYILKNSTKQLYITKKLETHLEKIDYDNAKFLFSDDLKEFKFRYWFQRYENSYYKGSDEGLMCNKLIEITFFLEINEFDYCEVESIKIAINDNCKDFCAGPIVFEGTYKEFGEIYSSYCKEEQEIFTQLLTGK